MSRPPVSGRQLEQAISRAVLDVVETEGLHVMRESNKNAPRLTGDLRGSAKVDALRIGDRYTATISYNMPYAEYQHEGISRFTGRDLQYGRRADGRGAVTDARIGSKFLERAMNDRGSQGDLLRKVDVAVGAAIRRAAG